ncbi:phosphoribosylamine--glycine ligase [Clostridium saccharobutylicum]|uniref:Phosphoribosylamine--glycine ligase n=1 Tax=Clostridium saccharobutylicum DSM 13864 TaxID=1345695 RepID=U5MRK7_CLOSA|nr:phosphoribosylamine--glycine ligase [Clostridium saccharobutylicum]AGX42306.1 phosphoribosylamine--glycine ligase PurD [Clostridium saccharobutylicum DSM 13864]AQR89587.1 phosphoribosylamine--glycine ligase [Clostridium saccharobutylicum]AQR99489.1 phosphoribosylamine--glycine ligase [Clostridium saccharobutylicum]AQS13475.1 phosphoribosylamine--glycine ligase [Clostridium saccharobutylicum]MBA2904335.1 phosphoribosylamine--glycine ligase [Clostridium saccharobutylicum]
MKLLLIGSGGREHALAWKFAQSKKVEKIFVAPGNGGTAIENKCENVNITDIDELVKFAQNENVDLTVVGPEDPLTKGIVNKFKKEGLKIFGPAENGAKLEGSKSFSKEFMKKYGVKTAQYETFTNVDEALKYLEICEYPTVVKADGLAAGKGVAICANKQEAEEAVKSYMVEDIFNGAGQTIVIEEFLEGVEASILSITDGKTIIPFISGKDHKQIFDGGKGPNTGGMGVLAPNPYVTEAVMKEFEENIMAKTLNGIKEEGFDYKGIIFFGIMITKKGTYLLEYNVRMGDPETQSVLYLMESDLVEVIEAALREELDKIEIKWKDGVCINVVLASNGYPGNFTKGYEIKIDEKVKDKVFLAGAKFENGILKTNGGRVLSVIGLGKDTEEARKDAYNNIKYVQFEGAYCRTDIGTHM